MFEFRVKIPNNAILLNNFSSYNIALFSWLIIDKLESQIIVSDY